MPDVHKARWQLWWDLVLSIVLHRTCRMVNIAMGLVQAPNFRAAVKRVDRALSNRALGAHKVDFAKALAHFMISKNPRPALIIDATKHNNKLASVRVSVAFQGRAIPLINVACKTKQMSTQRTYQQLVRKLRACLPAHCRPVLLCDGEYQGPFFDLLQDQGWDYIGRLAQSVLILPPNKPWTKVLSLFAKAGKKPKSLGTCQVTQSRSFAAQVVLYDGRRPKTRRKAQADSSLLRTRRTKIPSRDKYRVRAYQPWVLVSSLIGLKASDVVGQYKRRMQIEQTFRDDKSSALGLGLGLSRCRKVHRLDALLVLATLANWVYFLLGLVGQHRDLWRQTQGSSAHAPKARQPSIITRGYRLLRFFKGTVTIQELQKVLKDFRALNLQMGC